MQPIKLINEKILDIEYSSSDLKIKCTPLKCQQF